MSEKENHRDIAWTIAKHLVDTRFESLSPEVVEFTKKSILDTLGVMAAASGLATDCRMLVDLVTEAGGKPESTIMGFGTRVPAWMAAFVNGALAHCLDFDDLYYEAPVHPSAPVISASLAVAERVGQVSGRDFITAVALGSDLTCRLGRCVDWKQDWAPTTVWGVFGATAASGKLLKLDEPGMVSALGIALSEAAGTQEMRYSVGNHLGGMNNGYPARGGVLSALMAHKGILGPENSLEGRAGFFNVYFGGSYDKTSLVGDLGRHFLGTEAGTKVWPTTGTTHVYIDATLQIINEHDIKPEDIQAITLHVGDFAMLHCQPIADRRRPQKIPDAKYSIPFTVAIAATRKRVTLSDLTLDAIRDSAVLAMAQKVDVKLNPRFNPVRGEPPGMVEIVTKAGRLLSKQLEFCYGHHLNPVSTADVIQKFRDCVSHAIRPPSSSVVEQIVDTVMNLEKKGDIRHIMQSLS